MPDHYAPYSCMDNSRQEIARVLVRKISSSLSILGSTHILSLVWKKWRLDGPTKMDPYQRIMAMYGVFDILFSFFYFFLGTWMTPAETGWWGAVGNEKTCTMQGFFFMIGYGTAAYQMTLSLQMLLLVVYMWTPAQFAELLERKLHVFHVFTAIFISLMPIFFDSYNPKCGTCLPVPKPYWCGEWVLGDGSTQCVRGDDTLSGVYQFIFWIIVSLIPMFCTGSMVRIYLSVYLQERRMTKYNFGDEDDDCFKESKRIRNTMLLYTSSFYICWIIPIMCWHAPHSTPALYIVADFFFPLMGFFHMLIFTLPKCVKYQNENPGTNKVVCYFFVIFQNQIDFVKRVIIVKKGADLNNASGVDANSCIFENHNQSLNTENMATTLNSQNNSSQIIVPVSEEGNSIQQAESDAIASSF
mmetsp:Transcript_42093/g.88339  ORF Transcript_42093/g.88339 Transcript_42093/m.88339 type:complete len:413 (+) Transcript_42093:126-1364(+)